MKTTEIEKKKLSLLVRIAFIFISGTMLLVFNSCTKDEVIETIDTIEEAVEEEGALDNLNGNWIRIASNNPTADGMIIEMKGAQGKLTDKASSNFQVGDVKWNDIKAIDVENFDYEELGSDYNYYPSKMQLKADDTLRISVGSSGAGNIQKWVREGEYTPGDPVGQNNTETLPCNISETMTLTNGSAEVDYIVDCVVDITAPLVIEAGVVIQFAENAGFGVYDGGTLNAVGSETSPIVFSGTSSLSGWWRGIHMETRSSNNRLENVVIEDAGSNYVYCCNESGSILLKGAKVALENVSIKNGGSNGMVVLKDTEFDAYNKVNITTHKGYPLHIAPDLITALDGLESDYSGNEKDFVFVPSGSIAKPTTWSEINVPYLLEGNVLDITQALTVAAGSELVFQENGGLGIYDTGSLTVNGEETKPVIMRGAEPIRGFWRGIHMETSSLSNSMNYLQLSDAGGNYVYCCNEMASLFLKDGIARVTNSTFSNGKSYGIVTKPNFEFSTYKGNTITTHEQAPLYIDANKLGTLDGEFSSYVGNDSNYILIYNSQINKETVVQSTDVPLRVEKATVIDIIERLGLQAGVVIEFEENSGLGVYDNGVFNVLGTADKKVIFRGSADSKGFWRGIHTETNSMDNVIRHAEITHAGSNYVYCCNDPASIFVKSGQITVENTDISKSGGCGIFVKAGATLTEGDNTFSENEVGHICN